MLNPAPPYRSLYTYAWDVQDPGPRAFIEHALELGAHDVSLALSYHAGKFIRPRAQRGPRVIFPEDGVVYFNPRQELYGEIKPQAHSDAALRDSAAQIAADGRLRLHSWTVLMHNTRLGLAYPQYRARNVFGESYLYSLCPMQEAVFEYAVQLCRDMATALPLHSLILETPGWLPYAHGYHHEFAQLLPNSALDSALGICYCSACQANARAHGLDITGLMQQQRDFITQQLQRDDAASVAEQAELNQQLQQQLAAYTALRQQRVTALVTQIKATLPQATQLAVIPSVQRPSSLAWQEGSDLAALAAVADVLEIPLYEKNLADFSADLAYCQAISNKLRLIMRPGFPDLQNGDLLEAALALADQAGLRDWAFYNYGLLPEARLRQLARALQPYQVLAV